MAADDSGKVGVLWTKLTTAASIPARKGAAMELAEVVSASGVKGLLSFGLLDKMRIAMDDQKNPLPREGAVTLFGTLSDQLGQPAEPHLLQLLPSVLERVGDKVMPIKVAAEGAAKAFVNMLSPHAIPIVVPVLFDGINNKKSWKTQEASISLLALLANNGPRQLAKCMPEIVPILSNHMVDGKEQVQKAALAAMTEISQIIGNRDIEEFVPELVNCIIHPTAVPECIHKLSGITFVQAVQAPALSMMVPLLLRGMKERATIVKRKTVVVIDNMTRLVDDPSEAAPFLPQLLPGVERVSEEVADPECRATGAKVVKALKSMKEEVESDEATELTKKADPAVVVSILKGVIASGAREEADTPLFAQALDYASKICSTLILKKDFESEVWVKCVTPYLEPFLAPWGEDSETVCKNFLKKIIESCQEAEELLEDEDGGEDLCNCEFSLGYGGKILLNNTRLWLKRGHRYGLCGHNGCGKSTLMRAIANDKLDGFPHPDVLKTMYVEHDIDGSVVDLLPVEFLMQDKDIAAKGTGREVIDKLLRETGFTEGMMIAPIASLSGGWKMKLALVRAQLIGADILLLDEPTNHLDVTNVAWLEKYLTGLKSVSCLIVSHDSGFLDNVCTDIIHYEKRKLKNYRGNLAQFVKVKPEAQVYYDLSASPFKYKFPEPGPLEGIKRKETPIIKLTNVFVTYPGCPAPQLENVNVQCGLGSRVAVLGANGAGKSTLIKVVTGELKASSGLVWKHPNLGIAYVAQHAFHHVEQHLEKSPNEYIRWRFDRGEDREELNKVNRKISKDEEKKMEELIMHNGMKKQVERLQGRRKSKKSYEYEVKWVGLKEVFNTWLSRELLEDMGFVKLVHELDSKEVARLGLYSRPCTIAGVQAHFDDFGLDAEFGTYGQIKNLSGGQKVKVVLAAAMWSNPHMVVLDEPTNFLDRDSLGALAGAIKDYNGAVMIISHNKEFLDTLCNEQWMVANRTVVAPGNPAYEKAIKAASKPSRK
eukprot:TRINITY_DN1446_c0_g1_i1.p1 TRINITY_DN1446_c0_g1~~TRINITY_DN1446_c0_g1_i1.p1  ORF type:complete len:994 (+),score=230.02 TRINITY_DN1446_c0_g1_i1:209-3190(+)